MHIVRIKKHPVPPEAPSRLRAFAAQVRASPFAFFAARVGALVVVIGALAVAGRGSAAKAAPAVAELPVASAGASEPAAAPPSGPAAAPPPVVADAGPPPTASRGTRASPDDPVYLNQADRDALRRLPGVGPKRAEAILALRAKLGRFQRLEDLLRVRGIGRTTLRRWRPILRLDAPAPTSSDGGAP